VRRIPAPAAGLGWDWGRAGSGRRRPDGGRRRWRTTAEERVCELRAWAAPLRMKTTASQRWRRQTATA
jgi:hypothetical protein